MVINIIGDCDKRPVLYTVMKICQNLGDVLLLSNSTRLRRLSDTRETYGYYQNTMIAITTDGVDDFFDDFKYSAEDFDYMIVDNITMAEADVVIYVEGLVQSETEEEMLEYIEDYSVIPLYKGNLCGASTCRNLEQFEALRDMCPINNRIATKVAEILAPYFNKDAKSLVEIAMLKNPSPDTSGKTNFGKKKKGGFPKWH